MPTGIVPLITTRHCGWRSHLPHHYRHNATPPAADASRRMAVKWGHQDNMSCGAGTAIESACERQAIPTNGANRAERRASRQTVNPATQSCRSPPLPCRPRDNVNVLRSPDPHRPGHSVGNQGRVGQTDRTLGFLAHMGKAAAGATGSQQQQMQTQ